MLYIHGDDRHEHIAEHAASAAASAAITSNKWDVVVLQEQSEIPSVEQFRQSEMYPAARRLADTIYRHGSRPMFFLTWAHRDGWPENGLPDYVSMQSAIDDGYLAIAAEEQAAVAPVGVAWSTTRRLLPSAEMFREFVVARPVA